MTKEELQKLEEAAKKKIKEVENIIEESKRSWPKDKEFRTITRRLSDRLDLVYELAYEGTPAQQGINTRLVDKKTGTTMKLSVEETKNLFNCLY